MTMYMKTLIFMVKIIHKTYSAACFFISFVSSSSSSCENREFINCNKETSYRQSDKRLKNALRDLFLNAMNYWCY